MFKWNFLYSVYAHCLLYFYWAPLKRVWLFLSLLPHQVFICIDKIAPAIQPQLSPPLLTYARCFKMWPCQYGPASLVLEAQYSRCVHTLTQPGILLATFAAKALLAHGQLIHQDPQVLSKSCISRLYRCMELVSASLLPWLDNLGFSSLGLTVHSVDATGLLCKEISSFGCLR